MRARIFAFCCLMALFAWGAWSTYHMLFVSFNWREELPDPSFDYSKPHPCPDAGALRQYVIETTNWSLVVFKPKAAAPDTADSNKNGTPEGTDGSNKGNGESAPVAGTDPGAAAPGTGSRFRNGIPAVGVRITVSDPELKAQLVERLRKGPDDKRKDDTIIADANAADWHALASLIQELEPVKFDGAYIRSGPGTGLTISVTNPLDGSAMIIDHPQPYIVPAGLGTCPETLLQLNGVGVPWAVVIGALVLLVALWLSWKVAFGRWASTMLIETDQEMNKVAWPTRERVFNSSVVVVFCTLFFAVLLFASDWLLKTLIKDVLALW